jgi:hypothetical protein
LLNLRFCNTEFIVLAQSLQRWATDWTIGVLEFDSRRELGIFLFTTVSRTALGPTQPSIQWVTGALSLGIKRPGREADHSPPSSAKDKNAWSYFSTPQCVFMAWCLVKLITIEGSSPCRGWEFFSSPSRPERLWGPPSLLSKGYGELFPRGKAAGT